MHQITPCLTENEVKLFEYIKDIFNNTIPYKPNSTIINSIFYMNKEGKCVYRFTESSNPNYSVSKEFVKNLNEKCEYKVNDPSTFSLLKVNI